MSFLTSITSAEVFVAVMVYGLLAVTEPFLESWLHGEFKDNPPFQWGWDQFFAPLIRAVMLVLFVYLAYPALFGLTAAPTIGALLTGDEVQTNELIGVVFLVGFLASLLPGLGRNPEFVLPIQGSLATAYVFHWLTGYLGMTTATFWPGVDIVLTMILVSFFAHHLGRVAGKAFGDWLDGTLGTRGYDLVIVHAFELLGQIPVVLLFGYGLGRQLAI
jgi:hypothetical protein